MLRKIVVAPQHSCVLGSRRTLNVSFACASKRIVGPSSPSSSSSAFSLSSFPLLSSSSFLGTSRRFYASPSAEATRDMPKTPNGDNAYDVMEIKLASSTTLEDIAKQYKKMTIKYHPDRVGGSHEKMTEVNTAHQILKENHESVLKKLAEAERSSQADKAYRREKHPHLDREEKLGRTGGIGGGRMRTMRPKTEREKVRSPQEIQSIWEKYRDESRENATRMIHRFEVACEKGIFFQQITVLSELTARERWLRKTYIKGVWEEVHELRTELMSKKGAKNLQITQLADDMVRHASETEKRLNDDFARQSALQLQAQLRIASARAVKWWSIASAFIIWIGLSYRFWQSVSITINSHKAWYGTEMK